MSEFDSRNKIAGRREVAEGERKRVEPPAAESTAPTRPSVDPGIEIPEKKVPVDPDIEMKSKRRSLDPGIEIDPKFLPGSCPFPAYKNRDAELGKVWEAQRDEVARYYAPRGNGGERDLHVDPAVSKSFDLTTAQDNIVKVAEANQLITAAERERISGMADPQAKMAECRRLARANDVLNPSAAEAILQDGIKFGLLGNEHPQELAERIRNLPASRRVALLQSCRDGNIGSLGVNALVDHAVNQHKLSPNAAKTIREMPDWKSRLEEFNRRQ